MTTLKKITQKTGRKPKADPCRHRYTIHLNDVDNAKFLGLFDESGMRVKSHFIIACIFGKRLKIVKVDKATMDYYMRLTSIHSQYRSIGVNYNQVTKALKTAFTEKMALSFLYKLEKASIELVELSRQIILLTEEFERKWLRK